MFPKRHGLSKVTGEETRAYVGCCVPISLFVMVRMSGHATTMEMESAKCM